MVRDDDYMRELLLEAEASEVPWITVSLRLSKTPEELKRYSHILLLNDAGLFAQTGEGVFRLTNLGHDYLAAIRSDTAWAKTKDVASKAGGLTLGMMIDTAFAILKQKVAEQTGLEL